MRRQVFTIDHVLLDSYTTERAMLIKFLNDADMWFPPPAVRCVWFRLKFLSKRICELQRIVALADLNR